LKKIIVLCLFSLALTAAAYCGQPSRIELIDGSVINGEIVSFLNGIYTVNTGSLGEVKLEASKISQIKTANAPSFNIPSNVPAQTQNFTQPNFESYKQKLMSDPGNAAVVSGLVANPRIQQIAKDPQIEEAVKAGDMQALMNNPKFMEMVNSPEMQEGIRKLKKE